MNIRNNFSKIRGKLPGLVICLAFVLPMAGCFVKMDSVPLMMEKLPELSKGQPKPVWQKTLAAQETDFIQYLSKDRILVGTIEAREVGWGLAPKDVMMLNARDGEALWAASREPAGRTQTLLAVEPVILLRGNVKYLALNPENGAVLWDREQKVPEGSLLLADGERIVVFSQKGSTVSLTALNLKDGKEAWRAAIENYPAVKDAPLDIKAGRDAVFLAGPELAAVSAADGGLLWRKPFPGAFGKSSAAISPGDDLYCMDGSSVTRLDPATGASLWRVDVRDGTVRNLSADDRMVFVIERSAGDGPDAIRAWERKTGKPLWKFDLQYRSQSSLTTDGHRLYVTTAGRLFVLDASAGTPVYSAAIPAKLRFRNVLPDIIRISESRITVARETGVMSVQKQDGRLLFAEAVENGEPFTGDYTMHKLTQAVESATPLKARQQFVAQAAASRSDAIYRSALADQQSVYARTAEALRTGTYGEKQMASRERILAADRTIAAAEMQRLQNQMQATTNLANAIMGVGQALAGAMIQTVRASRMSVMQAEVNQAYKTHVNSLQRDFYIRPFYREDRGWSLAVVNINTGKRANILVSPDNEPLAGAAPNLPAFSIDPSGSRIVSKGLGLEPSKFNTYEKLAIGGMWNLPYPSVLAFELGSLRFEHVSVKSESSMNSPVDPGKKKLNDQLLNAAFASDRKKVKNALDSGADVNAKDEYGHTPLMLAAESLRAYNNQDIIELLLDRGADPLLKDPNGWTAMEHLCMVSWDAMTWGVAKGGDMLREALEKSKKTKLPREVRQ